MFESTIYNFSEKKYILFSMLKFINNSDIRSEEKNFCNRTRRSFILDRPILFTSNKNIGD